MFESILENKIKNEFLKSISGLKARKQFSINDVLNGNASEFTKKFIKLEIIDRKKENNTSEKELNTIDKTTSSLTLNQYSIINKEILNGIVQKAVKLYFNYTIRPKWTLLNYLFKERESASVEFVRNKLTIFEFYKYYIDTIINYFNDRPEPANIIITKSRTQLLLDETDTIIHEKLLTNPSSVKVRNFFLQLFQLKYNEVFQPKLDDSIPFGFIRIFLEDKSFFGILERFIQFYNEIYDELSDNENLYDSKEIKLKDIIKIITGQIKIEEAEIKYITPEINNDYLFIIEDAFETKKEEFPKTRKSQSNDVNFFKKTPSDIFVKEEIEKIQKKVFKNNKVLLKEFMDSLSNYNSWEEVSEMLKTLFEENNVRIYDEDVIQFVNKLNDYFSE